MQVSVLPGEKIYLNTENCSEFINGLDVSERKEQIADWTLYAIASVIKTTDNSFFENTSKIEPLRSGEFSESQNFYYGNGRFIKIENNEMAAIIPQDKNTNSEILETLADDFRTVYNKIPDNIYIFEYSGDTELNKYYFYFSGKKKGIELFTEKYNYFESRVNSLDDLKYLISKINDITFLSWGKKHLVLGGRFFDKKNSGLNINEIADIYKAYNIFDTELMEKYNDRIEKLYELNLKSNKALRKMIFGKKITKEKIIEKIKKQFTISDFSTQISNTGFSLDPDFDYNGFAKDLMNIIDNIGNYPDFPDEILKKNADELKKLAELTGAKKTSAPLIDFKINLQKQIKEIESSVLNDFISEIELKNMFQSARYDGKKQGTVSGMILFYTDLIAKLWAINYNNSFPYGISPDFLPMPDLKISKIYWDELEKLRSTRLWFGVRDSAYAADGNCLYFSNIATRVYAASSDPLYPGKESAPNRQSGRFLGWWDRHYPMIADFEPYYYKLNQIMKWSIICLMLNEQKNDVLQFINLFPNENFHNFKKWYENNNEIVCRKKINFLDEKKFNKKTECLPLLKSRNYTMMNRLMYLYGGVSLAARKDILKKLKNKKKSAPEKKHYGNASTVKKKPGKINSSQPQYVSNKKSVEKFYENPSFKLNKSELGVIYFERKKNNEINLKLQLSEAGNIRQLLNILIDKSEKSPDVSKAELLKSIAGVTSLNILQEEILYSMKYKDKKVKLSVGKNIFSGNKSVVSGAGCRGNSQIFYFCPDNG